LIHSFATDRFDRVDSETALDAKCYTLLSNLQRVAGITFITIDLCDNQLQKLQNLAKVHGISPKALLRASLEGWFNSPKPEFNNAAEYVLRKNAQLYKRLA
jgi:hypothetical protein